MKGHRRKKISVGPESLRGRGLALGGGICCQEDRVRRQPRPQLRLGEGGYGDTAEQQRALPVQGWWKAEKES